MKKNREFIKRLVSLFMALMMTFTCLPLEVFAEEIGGTDIAIEEGASQLIEDNTSSEIHTHVYEDEMTAPTCTEQGFTTHACECGDSYVDSYVEAKGHAYKNGVCAECGKSEISEAEFPLDLFVFAGQSNMMGASVLEPQVNAFTDKAWEYKYMPKLRGAETGAFVSAQNPAGEWYYNDLNAAYGDRLYDLTYKATVKDYSSNTYFCPAMRDGVKGFSGQSEADTYPAASLAPYFVTEYAEYGHSSIYAHMAKGSAKIIHYFTTDMMNAYNTLISAYNAENNKSYKVLTAADLTGAGDAFDAKYTAMLEDYATCAPNGNINNKCFVWLQGESDGYSYIEYKLKMQVLWEHLQTLGFTHFFVLRVGYWGSVGILDIIKAQEDFCAENENCYIVTRAPSLVPHPDATTANWWINDPSSEYDDCRDSYLVNSSNNHFNEKAMRLFAERSAENVHRILYQGLDPILEEENIRGMLAEEDQPEEDQPEDTSLYTAYVGTEAFYKGISVSSSSDKWMEKSSTTAASTELIPVASCDSVWLQYVFHLSEAHAVGGFYDKNKELVAPLYYKDFGFTLGGSGGTAAFLTPERNNRVSVADIEAATGKEIAFVRFTAWQASLGGHANTEARIYHDYTTTITAPTCTEQGFTTHACECGDSYVDTYVEATGHDYKGGKCTACGETFEGKTISILGDSISTFTGVSNDASVNSTLSGGAIYYNGNTFGISRSDTWWQQVVDALDMRLLVNNSWSGSCVLPTRSGTEGAYKGRCINLHNDTTGEEPDIIAVFLGTNDFSYYQSTLGTAEINYDKLISEENGIYTYAEPATTCEAYAIMLHKMTHRYPEADIYCMNMLARRDPDKADNYADVGQPTDFNGELAKVIAYFGCTLVDLENCGIDKSANIFDNYIGDQRVHPNAAGMDLMSQAVINGITQKETKLYNIRHELTNVTLNHSESVVLSGNAYSVTLSAAEGYKDLTVVVSMGGKDITDECYKNGVITIPEVSGDIIIAANSRINKNPENYHWGIDGNSLVSFGDTQNAVTRLGGSISNNTLTNAYYRMEKPVVLQADLPWVVEFKASGAWSGMIFSSKQTSNTSGNSFLFKTITDSGLIAFGEYSQSQYHNFGSPLTALGVDTTKEHVYRIENRITDDGDNMAYLVVDGIDYGAMNNYFIGGNRDQKQKTDWLNGRDFTFSYIGANSHSINNCKLSYLKVWENGEPATPLALRYDDHYDVTGKTVEIIDAGNKVVTIEGNYLVATGIGEAKVRIEDKLHLVTVEKAKINIVTIMGQSNAGNHFANATSDVTCPIGTAYWWGNGQGVNAAEPVDYTQPSMGFHTPLLAELYAQSVAAGDPVKNVLVWQEGITSKNGQSIVKWAATETDTSGTDGTATMLKNCIAYYEKLSDKFEIVNCGVYWLQGESDVSMEPEKYTKLFMAMWSDLKEAGAEYVAFFRVRKGTIDNDSEHLDLSYSGSLTAQLNMINRNADMFLVSDITENWVGNENVEHVIDVSPYLTVKDVYASTGSYSDAYGNTATYKDGLLTTTMKTLYGSNNKCHYGKFGYGIIGADAAVNMYQALNSEEFSFVMADTSGRVENQRSFKNSDTAKIDITDITENLAFRAACGSTAGTLEIKVTSGCTDITEKVIDKGITTFGTINTELLCDYDNVEIVITYYPVHGNPGKVEIEVVDNTPETAQTFIWDFNEDLNARGNDGTVLNGLNSAALLGEYKIEDGVLKAKGLQLQFTNKIKLSERKNWSIEWKFGVVDESTKGFLLCNTEESKVGTKTVYISPDVKISISDYADNYGTKGYRNYYTDDAAFTSGDVLRIANEYDSEKGRGVLRLWKNGKLIVDDFQKYGNINKTSGTLSNMTGYPLSGDFEVSYLGCKGIENFSVTGEIDYIKIITDEPATPLALRYDDHYDVVGKTVEIINAGKPTSYQVGYGVEENKVPDTAVVTLEGETLVATGIGTAYVRIDGQLYEVAVSSAPISLMLLIGQSNMEGNEGDANKSISCPDGQVYATYGDRYDMNITNATHYAPSALTGAYREINTVGGTDGLSDYPVYMLTDEGDGRKGPDSGFAYEWVKQTGEKVWVVNASHGGTSLNVWQPETTQYEECQAMFGACTETLRKEIAAGHFTLSHMMYFWCQGCNDYDKTAEWYVENYLSMHESLKSELAFDHDSDPNTADKTFEYGGIIPVRAGHEWRTYYREGTYTDTTTASYYESFKDLQMSGPRVAQYWMGNNPELEDLWIVCTIGEDWVWMPDGTNGVSAYFQKHYENGTVDYTPQVKQSASWYTPTTPAAVHDSIHYNQIGYNEVGRESVRNALIYMGINPDYDTETTVTFVDWTGYKEASTVYANTSVYSGSLVVPIVKPVTRCKDVAYAVSDGLSYDWYDLTADSYEMTGSLTATGMQGSVSVVEAAPEIYYAEYLNELPETFCGGVNLWPLLQHNAKYYTVSGWGTHNSGQVYSVTIPVAPGDKIWATSMGANGTNGNTISTGNGIRVTFFGDYQVITSMTSDNVYKEFAENGYLTAPAGATAVNVPMWNNSDDNELYLLSASHDTTSDICSICGKSSHTHEYSDWILVREPSAAGVGEEQRVCACGEVISREVEGVWQTHELNEHLSQLPETVCKDLNLWSVLEHDREYYHSGVKWDVNTSADVYSITIPVNPGDKVFATSFGKGSSNGGSSSGIRCTFFSTYEIAKTLSPAETYAEFSQNGGYLVAPENAVAINIPMWNNSDANEVYLLNYEHSYESGICTGCGARIPDPKWEIGTIASLTGENNATNSRLRTVNYLNLTDFIGVGINEGYTMTNFAYDENYTYLGTSSWLGSGIPFETEDLIGKYPTAKYFRVVFRTLDQKTLTEDAVSASGVRFYLSGEEIPEPDLGFEYENVAQIGTWQDGAIWDGKLFALNAAGGGAVFDVDTGAKLADFTLDKKDVLKPHANSVCFGSTYYADGDKYPLLYVNIYNNYANADDRMEGTCCVYRLSEAEGTFTTELVQVIRIGFVEDLTLWKSKENNGDVRPYGNFVVDTDNHQLYAFVMRDAFNSIRFFSFDIPSIDAGSYSEAYGCNVVTLSTNDINDQFDTEHYNYLQGCCYSSGMILSAEGFGGDAPLRIIDLQKQCVSKTVNLGYAGLKSEPEVLSVDPDTGTLYYAAADGMLRIVKLDDVHFHVYTSTVTAPTCTEQGYTAHTCSVCGDSYVDSYVDATGHTYNSGICTACGEKDPDYVPTFLYLNEAVAYLREQMKARIGTVTLRIADMELTAEKGNTMLSDAIAHTGVPTEGDYFRRNMGFKSCSVTTGEDANGVYSDLTFKFNWYTTAEMEAEVDAAVETLLDELNLWNASDYEKIVGVYDWISENIEYDHDRYDEEGSTIEHTTYAAIVDRLAVCQGYASLYYRLLLELGVDCRVISGLAGLNGGESHAWNIVKLEGKYYNADPTWDADLKGHYRYFLCTMENFKEHVRDDEFDSESFHTQYPMSLVPYVVNATASGSVNGAIEWVLDGETGTLTVAGTGAIPSYRYGSAPWYPYRESVKSIVVSEGITEVGERAFYWCTNCTSVTLPESLVAIREYGFNNLRALQEIKLPSKLTTIEFCAFSECVGLQSIVIPNSVTTIGSSAFSNCYALTSATLSAGMTTIPDSMFFGDRNLKKVVLQNGLTTIGDTAFADCGITSFTIPSTVTSIGVAAFAGCRSNNSFTVKAGNTAYKAVNGVLFTYDGKTLVSYPAGKFGNSYAVPEGTVTIDHSAFSDAYMLKTITFASSVRTIQHSAFAHCDALASITFPSGITSIGDSALRECDKLTSVTFENPDVVLGPSLFADCDGLVSIQLPTRLKELSYGMFSGCAKLKNVTIPSTVTKMGSTVFADCDSLVSITVPGNVKSLGQQAFDFCNNLETIIFEEGVESLGWICIRNAPSLKKVVLPSSITTIEKENFEECPNVVVYVNCGSVAHRYAQSNGVAASVTHSYETTVTAPTCTDRGYTTHTCAVCSNSYKDAYVSALGHSYGNWEIVKESTCTEQGSERRDCVRCDAYETQVIEVTEHPYKAVVTAPTCTEQGYTTHTCSDCGDSYVDGYVDATGHSFNNGVCINCGLSKKPYQRLTYFTVDVKSEAGKTYADNAVLYLPDSYAPNGEPVKLIIYCKQGSSKITASSNPIESVGFYNYLISLGYAVLGVDGVPDAWRDELGLDDTRVVGNPLAVQATENAYKYVIENYNIAADGCFISGYSQGGHYAQNVIDLTNIPILAAAEQSPVCSMRYHQWDLNATVTVNSVKFTKAARLNVARIYGFPAVATDADLLNLSYDASLVAQYDPWLRNTENPYAGFVQKSNLWYLPEGTSLGSITMSKTTKCPVKIWCAEDDTAISADVMKVFVKAIQNAGGTAEISVAQSGGHGFFQKQSAVGKFVENGKTYNTLPIAVEIAEWFEQYGGYACQHDYASGWSVSTAPTCTEKGMERRTCANCGYSETRAVAANGHTEVIDEAVAPTCTETGLTEGKHCSVCDAVLVKQEVVAAKGHDYKAVVTAPTCTERGYTTHTCTACGDNYVDSYVDATGHGYGKWTVITAPTCTEQGTERRDCKSCDHFETREVAAIGHTEVIDKAVAPTCTETGLTEGKHCSVCDAVLVKQEVVAAKGHSYKSVVTAPTCTERGYTTHTCTVCGNSYVDGYVDATGEHVFGAWLHLIPPSKDSMGIDQRTCTTCNMVETKEVSGSWQLYDLATHIQKLPDNFCCGTNLWEALTPSKWMINHYGEWVSAGATVYSITIPITPGDKIYANSFVEKGIQVSFIGDYGIVKTLFSSDTKKEFNSNGGYLVAPEGAIAVNVPVWDVNDETNTVNILNYDHVQGVVNIEATCTEDGYTKEGCLYCEQGEIKDIVKAKGHTEVVISGTAATCTTSGLTDGSYCSVCNQILAKQEIIPAGHKISMTSATIPSVNASGLTAGIQCRVCKTILVAQKELPPVKELKDYLRGMQVSILGDSISTYLGISNDADRNTHTVGNVAGYRDGGYYNNDDVTSVDLTWWMQSINAMDMELLVNHASGSGRLLTTPSNGTLPAYYDEKCLNLHDNAGSNSGMEPDIIAVYIGVNDGSMNKPAGSLSEVDFSKLITGTDETGFHYATPTTMAEGYAVMLHKMQHRYSNSEIFLFTLPRLNAPVPDYRTVIMEVAAHFGVRVVDLYDSALTQSGYSKYFFDGVHPNAAGMKIIADMFQAELLEFALELHGRDKHVYTSAVTVPTCTEQGYTTHTCTVCGDSYVDNYVDATGHSYGEWTVTTAPTCTEQGVERRDCKNCDHFETRTIAAKGHTEVVDEAVEPTCTETGLTEGKHCSVCDAVLVKQEVVAAKGHSYKSVVTAPTCTEQGYTTHTCTVCGNSYVDGYVNAMGHSYDAWSVTTAPTCTEKGTERRDCKNCDHFETRTVAAKGHTEVIDKAVAPTCTETGLTEGNHCSVCGVVLVKQEVVKANGHDYDAVVTNPTCTEQGYTIHTCTVCDDSYVDSYVDAKGHSYGAWSVTTAPTCTEQGVERRDCKNCDHFETRTVAAKGHTEVIDEAVAPTCTETGLTEGKHCSVCDAVLVKQEVVAAKGHSYKSVVTAPTCTERGYTTHTCSVCDSSYVDSYVNAKGHSYGAWSVTTAPTCTEQGVERRDCQNCDHFETRDIAVKGHTEVIDSAVAPTCTETGLTEGKRCSVCDVVLVKQEVVAAKGHDYKSVVTAPTCTERGYTTHTCTVCGDSYVDSYVDATGHSYGEWTVTTAPTCIEQGVERRDCKNCDHFETRTVAAKGHTEVIDKAVAPTCTETGLTEGKHCSVCDAVLVKQEVVAANGHDYKAVVTAPTCTERGYTTHTCTVCDDSYVDSYVNAKGHSYGAWSVTTAPTCTEQGVERRDCKNCDHFETRTVAAKGHTEVIDKAVAPTCTETGLTEGKHCSVCDAVLVKQEVVVAKGHDYKTVVTAPTCTEQGYTTHTCTVCGDSYVDSYVDATGHSYGAWSVSTAPTCIEQGVERRDCKNCDHFETRAIAAKGHTEVIDKAVAPTCTETGLTEGKHCSVCDTVLVEQEVVAKSGHSYGAFVPVEAVPESGHYQSCSCGEETALERHEYGDDRTCDICSYVLAPLCCEAVLSQTYTGEAITPAVKVYYGEKLLELDKDYTVSYSNNINVPAKDALESELPTITICGKGYYIDTVSVTFTIAKATPALGNVAVVGTVKDTTDPTDVVLTGTNTTVDGTFALTDEKLLANVTTYHWTFTPTDTANYNVVTGEVEIDVLDTIAPAAVIKIEENQWRTKLNTITFGLFFRETKTVTIDYADNENGSGIDAMLYYVSDKAVADVANIPWETYSKSFNIDPDGTFVIYAKAVDKDGNSAMVNSDGIVLDATAPLLKDIVDGGIYYGDLTITASDALAGVKTVTLDGDTVVPENGQYTIAADNSEHTVVVTDKAGNTQQYTVHVMKMYTVSGTVTSYLTGDVTIELRQDGAVKYTTTSATGTGVAYAINDVTAGTYTMRVSKENHVTREYEMVVGTEAVTLDLKICPKGDADCNGKVNIRDWNAVKAHNNETALLTGYAYACADTDGNGKVNIRDWNALKDHNNETAPLW